MSSIVYANEADLKKIAQIHKEVYSKSHFTSLFSIELLIEFYSYYLKNGSSIILSLNDNQEIEGFIVFGVEIANKIQTFKSREKLNIWITAIKNPLVSIKKVTRSVYNRLFDKGSDFTETDYLILSIAVATQRKGIGSLLLREVNKRGNELNFQKIGLYVRVGNTMALNLYLKNGYKIISYLQGQYYMEKEN